VHHRPLIARPGFPLACAGGVLVAVAVAASALRPVGLASGPPYDGRSAVYLTAAAASFVLYVAGLATVRRAAVRLGAVCTLAAAIQLAPLAGPLFFSHDVYSYWAYGRIAAIHDADPYAVAPSAFPGDAATRVVAPGWLHERSVYGPAFTFISDALARVTGTSPSAAALAYRALAAAAVLALVVLAAVRAGPFAAAFAGWNPLLALQFAGGGHNDALMMVLVAAALALAVHRPRAGGAAWATAIALKWIPLALLPLHLLAERGNRRALAGAALAAAGAFALVACAAFGTSWLDAFGPLAHQAHTETSMSIGRRLGLAPHTAMMLGAAILVAGYAWLLRSAWNGRARIALAAGLLVLTTPWLLPWYAVWTVPLAAVENDRTARFLALGLCAYLLPGRVPF
jgi:hypothetical protein